MHTLVVLRQVDDEILAKLDDKKVLEKANCIIFATKAEAEECHLNKLLLKCQSIKIFYQYPDSSSTELLAGVPQIFSTFNKFLQIFLTIFSIMFVIPLLILLCLLVDFYNIPPKLPKIPGTISKLFLKLGLSYTALLFEALTRISQGIVSSYRKIDLSYFRNKLNTLMTAINICNEMKTFVDKPQVIICFNVPVLVFCLLSKKNIYSLIVLFDHKQDIKRYSLFSRIIYYYATRKAKAHSSYSHN